MTPHPPQARATGHQLPPTCGVAFKEWAGIRDALLAGRQSLIVRKGGIAEGPRGFVPEHEAFWLYPTHVHQAEQGLRATPGGPPTTPDAATPGTVELRALLVVDSIAFVDREETLSALRDLHDWSDETIARRFHYRKPGLWVLGVRAFARAAGPHILEVTAALAGCKSWVPLDPPLPTAGCSPVLDEVEFARRRERLRAALGRAD